MSRSPARSLSRGGAGGGAAITFAVVAGLALFGALFPWFPGEPRLNEGSVAPRAITAPRDRSYDSDVLTEARREQAAAAVEDVLIFDPGIRDRQLAALDRQLAAINAVRLDRSLSASARESAVRAVDGSSLAQRAASVLASAGDADWAALADEVRSALGRTLAVALNEQDLPQARQRLRGLLSPLLSSDQALALGELADALLVATQVVDVEETEARRDQQRASRLAVPATVARGQVIVAEGETITALVAEQLDLFGLRASGVQFPKLAATALIAVMAAAASGGYLFVVQPRALGTLRRLALFALLLVIPVLAAKFTFPLVLPDDGRHFLPYAVPLAAAPIAAAVLLDVTTALLLTVVLASLAAFVTVYLPEAGLAAGAAQLEPARMWLAVAAASLSGLYVAARADRLQRYLVAGVASAVAAGAALTVFWMLDADRRAIDLLWMAGATAAGGLLSALIAVGSFVLLSRPFGIITRVELMELAQLSHRLLRRLQDETPGTFQHSMLVGNLAERAADRIGADALLVRVGAYYHDVGKMVAPEFFVENFTNGDNPHEGLDPLQSTRVIHQHVTGGVEIARREGLPEAVVQFIPQHHGTRLMTFFYRQAAAVDEEIDPEAFRYPGPKPQSREAALVMLADGCEAAVRSAADRPAERIREIVEGIIQERMEEGQLDECDISLRDLRVVADSFSTALTAVYHPRVEYPQPTERELAERASPRPPEGESATALEEGEDHVPEGPPLASPETRVPPTSPVPLQGQSREPKEDDA